LADAALFARRFADDLEQQKVTILVAGEFKRGKSSLVNALIGEDLLPVDIVPTTAVTHVLHHGERGLVLHWRDGRKEVRPLSAEVLGSLASDEAGGSVDPEQIEFVEISLPNSRLAKGLVLVDTPGVNDLSDMRSEVVYQMIPRADAVIFVLDGTTQLTASEKTFLTDKLMQSLAPPLCFVMNKMDRIEEEEREGLIEEGQTLLADHLALKDMTILPASATLPSIGVLAINSYLDAFLAGGERYLAAERKRERLVGELKRLVITEAEARRNLASQDLESLRRQLEESRQASATLEKRWSRFQGYLQQNGPEALEPLVRQSFRQLCEDLERRLQPEVRTTPPQMFIEHLPLRLEDGFKGWLNHKMPEFKAFLDRYRAAMYQEFGQTFAQPSPADTGLSTGLALDPGGFRIESTVVIEEVELDSFARFGIPGAGALLGWMLISTGPFGMIVGSVLGSLFSSSLAKEKQSEVQQELAVKLHDLISQEGNRFIESVINSLISYMDQFAKSMERAAKTLNLENEQRLVDAIRLAESDEGTRISRDSKLAEILLEAERI
jgi:GTP-binding protein EngB required for normal cell division